MDIFFRIIFGSSLPGKRYCFFCPQTGYVSGKVLADGDVFRGEHRPPAVPLSSHAHDTGWHFSAGLSLAGIRGRSCTRIMNHRFSALERALNPLRAGCADTSAVMGHSPAQILWA